MSETWFADGAPEPAGAAEAEFLRLLRGEGERWTAHGLRPSETGLIPVGGVTIEIGFPALDEPGCWPRLHLEYSPRAHGQVLTGEWSFDGYVLDGAARLRWARDVDGSAREAAASAIDWLDTQLSRHLIRAGWHGWWRPRIVRREWALSDPRVVVAARGSSFRRLLVRTADETVRLR